MDVGCYHPDADQATLERFLMHAMIVAGKTAKFAHDVLERFLGGWDAQAHQFNNPFELVYEGTYATLLERLMGARTGNYKKLATGFTEIASWLYQPIFKPADSSVLRTCTPQQLEEIHGIGPKTSRYFILHTRKGARVAALDTHILKFLRALGHDAPKGTPSGKRYAELEAAFLAEADRLKMSPADLDAQVWEHYSKGTDVEREQAAT